ncbi:uncharacterized protein LOC129808458 [Phlebotomus papatasi]|uniref:uncharacterized protein LOC129808458 n=1 Tax=Phlebotomus papatasi TaxID=29031 RepID=UPI002483E9E5|nr:uncharacterized protein LOC129808458 [Phlebotomus papatasi]
MSQPISLSNLERNQRAVSRQLDKLILRSSDGVKRTAEEWVSVYDTLIELKNTFTENQGRIFEAVEGNEELMQKAESEYDAFTDKTFSLIMAVRDSINMARKEERDTGSSREVKNAEEQLAEMMSKQTDLLKDIVELQRASNTGAKTSVTKLPQLQLPTFGGEYSKWQTFHDDFKSTIHENPNLSKGQKMQYLKSSLKGAAAETAEEYKISDDNYEILWESLQKQYGKKVHIVNECIQKFLAQAKMKDGSLTGLKELTHTSKRLLKELSNLGSEYLTIDSWIIYLMKQLLDQETKKAWEESRDSHTLANLEEWFEFLETRIDAMERWSDKSSSTNSSNPKPIKKATSSQGSVKSHHTETVTCRKCSGSHELFQCKEFHGLSAPDRRSFVSQQSRVCFNCLRSDHIARYCQSKSRCTSCNSRHHSLLHVEQASAPALAGASAPAPTPEVPRQATIESEVPALTTHHSIVHKKALLPTALVKVIDSQGSQQICRILIDGGGECTLISEACVQRLGIERRQAKIAIKGAAEATVGYTRGLVSIQLTSIHDPTEHLAVEAYILSHLTSQMPSAEIVQAECWKQFQTLQLADPQYHTPGSIDIILGAEYAMAINLPQILKSENGSPVAQLTIFGWILGGKIHGEMPSITSHHTHVNLDDLLKRFWETEEATPNAKIRSPEEQKCEEHFIQNVRKTDSGRYEVRLPFKENGKALGDSQSAALARLRIMENKFQKDPEFKRQYTQFMHEYESMRHMELVPQDEEISDSQSYVIPHMAVLRPSSTTTKLRVVFDASARTKPNNVSLNDVLAVGPTVQGELLHLLIQFRTYKYAFTADIEKMYRQVGVSAEDRDFQRILWRYDKGQEVRTYRLTTVTYGTSCAPYLATRTLQQVAYDNEKLYPEAAQQILNNFYMDDLLGGAQTVQEATKVREDLQSVLDSSGFPLRKWVTNLVSLLEKIPEDQRAISPEDIYEGSVSALGLQWAPGDDNLGLVLPEITSSRTKRELCASVAKIFDPLGFISPVTAGLKMIFQQLWLKPVSWDDTLPDDIMTEVNRFQEEISVVQGMKIPRFIPSIDSQIDLVGFCDASEKGYGAVIYARGTGDDGGTTVTLVVAKSRVAPLKTLSIPRLELTAALLLSRLFTEVKKGLTGYQVSVTAFTDSMVVLCWLQKHPSHWKTFVANRTSQIVEIIPFSQWRHVVSEENPADSISRGLYPRALLQHQLYWNGPEWLKEEKEKWPESPWVQESDTSEEKVPVVQVFVTETKENNFASDLFNRFSNVTTLIRVVAYLLRWSKVDVSKTLQQSASEFLTVQELNYATNVLIRLVQKEEFPDELKCLQSGNSVKPGSKLSKLVPILDENGIMRVRGRIQNTNLSFDTQHPIILPGKHVFTRKLIERIHVTNLHSGTTLTQSILRAKYWVIGERNSVKGVIHKCVKCFRAKPRQETPLMGNLPAMRVQEARAFLNTGCDYAGPFLIRAGTVRKSTTTKAYICLFICMATKAIHLELVSDLSTEAFLAALRRFTARRGHCQHMFCDNATNFLGAVESPDGVGKRRKLHQEKVTKFMSESGTEFHFIPAYSPTFGGLWERGIGGVKFHLKRALSNTVMTFEEMYTVLTQIEACLNSRPLCQLTADPENFDVLTPGHFLIGQPLTLHAGPDLLSEDINRLKRWYLLQRLVQEFWKKWHREYITSLQERPKWAREMRNLQVGDLVLIKSDNLKTATWSLGRVIETHPGADSVVRVVTLKTSSGLTRRAVNKLAKLPVD